MERGSGDDGRVATGRKIAILRFSALGDIAIAAPLVKAYASSNSEVTFLFVSNPLLAPLFEGPPNLHYYKLDLRGRERGVVGMWRLFRELKRRGITEVADFHSVTRTHFLKLFFFLNLSFSTKFPFITSTPFEAIDKGRKEKRALTTRKK